MKKKTRQTPTRVIRFTGGLSSLLVTNNIARKLRRGQVPTDWRDCLRAGQHPLVNPSGVLARPILKRPQRLNHVLVDFDVPLRNSHHNRKIVDRCV